MKDVGKSVRTRLLNIAKKDNLSFQLVLIRYMQERLLYRISVSEYSYQFYLKGGALLYYYHLEKTRPTKDLDFLGTNLRNELGVIESVFRQICSIDYPPDSVTFDFNSIEAEEITEQDKYPGIRLYVIAHLDTIIQRLQVDIGFGDIVYPGPVKLNFPTFFQETETPVIQAYSLETVIAEKFEAMIDLSFANSRMKDFYDVYKILNDQQIDIPILGEAIKITFDNRKTKYIPDHALFSEKFYTDSNRLQQWKAFIKKNHLSPDIQFSSVILKITSSLFDIYENLK